MVGHCHQAVFRVPWDALCKARRSECVISLRGFLAEDLLSIMFSIPLSKLPLNLE